MLPAPKTPSACHVMHRKPPGVAKAPRKGSLFPWPKPGDPWSPCGTQTRGHRHRHSASLLPPRRRIRGHGPRGGPAWGFPSTRSLAASGELLPLLPAGSFLETRAPPGLPSLQVRARRSSRERWRTGCVGNTPIITNTSSSHSCHNSVMFASLHFHSEPGVPHGRRPLEWPGEPGRRREGPC